MAEKGIRYYLSNKSGDIKELDQKSGSLRELPADEQAKVTSAPHFVVESGVSSDLVFIDIKHPRRYGTHDRLAVRTVSATQLPLESGVYERSITILHLVASDANARRVTTIIDTMPVAS